MNGHHFNLRLHILLDIRYTINKKGKTKKGFACKMYERFFSLSHVLPLESQIRVSGLTGVVDGIVHDVNKGITTVTAQVQLVVPNTEFDIMCSRIQSDKWKPV